MKPKLKKALEKMTKMGIIKPTEELTDWVNSLVIVEKQNGKLRLCLDPRDLNKAIKREHYKLPTAEEIFAEMKNPKYFTKLDASNGYWQIPVDEESSKLLTFNSPFGRYSFTRLPYGIHSASEIFQAQVAKIIEGIKGTKNSQDDIIIWSETLEEHMKILDKVFSQLRKAGLKIK